MTNTDPIQLAIVGCGAITELSHLPNAMACQDVQVTALVDTDAARARLLAARHGIPHVLEDYRQISDHATAAVVAVPSHLHARVTTDLLDRGVHVLVEKPMAMRSTECDRMIAAARSNQLLLAVGMMRRFGQSWRFAKKVIDQRVIGRIHSFEVREGDVFGWPVTTPFFLSKEKAGGGVLIDAGVHVVDTLLWWFGDVESLRYSDDCFGGVEANCLLELTMAEGVTGTVELSRTRAMPNTAILYGEKGKLTIDVSGKRASLEIEEGSGGERQVLDGQVMHAQSDSHTKDMAEIQLSDFACAIRSVRSPFVDGIAGKRSIELIERCYAQRSPLVLPWVSRQ